MKMRKSAPSGMRLAACVTMSAVVFLSALAGTASGQVSNVKVVTDANPDYHDIGSLIHSATSNWPDTKDKCFALYYWNHIMRRQTQPMMLHGMELADPVRQANDYGYAMCSTISGINCAVWGAMGLDVRFWDITLHTVPEVKYDGAWHMYDNSMSAIYTTCDGNRIASVPEIGAVGSCEKSGGKEEPGHIARYHCLNATSERGFLTGADTMRSLDEEYRCFNPNALKYRYYYNNWDLGHRYALNLREGEVYTRYYHRLDGESTGAEGEEYASDRAFYVPNPPGPEGKDPEAINPRYRIRGNGMRTFEPPLDAAGLPGSAYSMTGVAGGPGGAHPSKAGQAGEVVFKVEGSNVITSMKISAAFSVKGSGDLAGLSISTTNGENWTQVWTGEKSGEMSPEIGLVDEVNGSYDVLVKAVLPGRPAVSDSLLESIRFETVTMLNSKCQPSLNIGRNTVYVGAGDQTGQVVVWPELQNGKYRETAFEEKNVASGEHAGYMGVLHPVKSNEDGYVVYRLTAPSDMTRLTYGGRFYNRAPNSRIELLHSLDGMKTWVKDWALTDTYTPWDVIHYEKVDLPAGTREVFVKYLMNSSNTNETGAGCSIYSLRAEADYSLRVSKMTPIEVTFNWSQRQADYSLVERSHTQLVESLPFTYTINVGGADHPVVNSLQVNLKGAAGDIPYGYSDGKDVGGEKYTPRWETLGTNLALTKPYTTSIPSETNWGAGDPDGKVLTDGVVGPTYVGGASYKWGALWTEGQEPEITVDLGRAEIVGAVRIQLAGYPWWDATKGEVKDKVEVLTSTDGSDFTSSGFFDFNLRWKDLPANYLWPQEETNCGYNFALVLEKPLEARFVRFKVTPARYVSISEVQVYDSISYETFDWRIALPDGTDRSDITAYLPKHTKTEPYIGPQ